MRKTNYDSQRETPAGVVLVDNKRLQDILSCGMQTAKQIAEEAGAAVNFGRRKLYNVEKIKAYLNKIGA